MGNVNKLRVLVFVKTFANPTLTFIYNEVDEISKYCDVLVITNERKNQHLFPFKNTIEIPLSSFLKNKFLRKLQFLDISWSFNSTEFSKQIKNIIDDFNPDIIHTHFGWESWFLLNNLKYQKPIFLSFHGFDASHKLKKNRYRNMLRKFLNQTNVHPIFISQDMANRVLDAIDEPDLRYEILYYGIDITSFKRQTLDPASNQYIFLQVSSFVGKKGHEYTLRAFAKFMNQHCGTKEVRLILAGDGPLRNKMMQLSYELKVDSYVDFPGLVNKQETIALMQKANCFVHHSVTSIPEGDKEGIPNALMEAMAMKLPVLSTIHSGIPELIQDGVNGFLVKERDVEVYASKMQEMLEWSYVDINRKVIEDRFEKKLHGRNLISIYQKYIKV